jgi:hypothetical protein
VLGVAAGVGVEDQDARERVQVLPPLAAAPLRARGGEQRDAGGFEAAARRVIAEQRVHVKRQHDLV